jgi:hypothetical protein
VARGWKAVLDLADSLDQQNNVCFKIKNLFIIF